MIISLCGWRGNRGECGNGGGEGEDGGGGRERVIGVWVACFVLSAKQMFLFLLDLKEKKLTTEKLAVEHQYGRFLELKQGSVSCWLCSPILSPNVWKFVCRSHPPWSLPLDCVTRIDEKLQSIRLPQGINVHDLYVKQYLVVLL